MEKKRTTTNSNAQSPISVLLHAVIAISHAMQSNKESMIIWRLIDENEYDMGWISTNILPLIIEMKEDDWMWKKGVPFYTVNPVLYLSTFLIHVYTEEFN